MIELVQDGDVSAHPDVRWCVLTGSPNWAAVEGTATEWRQILHQCRLIDAALPLLRKTLTVAEMAGPVAKKVENLVESFRTTFTRCALRLHHIPNALGPAQAAVFWSPRNAVYPTDCVRVPVGTIEWYALMVSMTRILGVPQTPPAKDGAQ